jgi:hypothetical protein
MNMALDRKYLLCAFAYAVFGMSIGIYMAASTNHSQLVSHAHILLVGFVVSFVYALIHKIWIAVAGEKIANAQFYLHQAATLVLTSSLLLLYGGILPESNLAPLLGGSSIGVLIGALLMVYMIWKLPIESDANS